MVDIGVVVYSVIHAYNSQVAPIYQTSERLSSENN